MRRLSSLVVSFVQVAAFFAAVLSSGCSNHENSPAPVASIGGGGGDGGGVISAPDRESLDPHRYDGPEVGTDRSQQGQPSTIHRGGWYDWYPTVRVQTNQGEFTLKLDRVNAPVTVDNFLEYVNSGFYNQTALHQVEAGFVIAGGGYTATMQPKKANPPIRNEAHNGLKNRRGSIAMVRFEEIDSATSQFLINLADNPQLDHKSREVAAPGKPDQYGYCVFGEVIAGWDVVEKIAQVKTRAVGEFTAQPVQPVVVESMKLVRP